MKKSLKIKKNESLTIESVIEKIFEHPYLWPVRDLEKIWGKRECWWADQHSHLYPQKVSIKKIKEEFGGEFFEKLRRGESFFNGFERLFFFDLRDQAKKKFFQWITGSGYYVLIWEEDSSIHFELDFACFWHREKVSKMFQEDLLTQLSELIPLIKTERFDVLFEENLGFLNYIQGYFIPEEGEESQTTKTYLWYVPLYGKAWNLKEGDECLVITKRDMKNPKKVMVTKTGTIEVTGILEGGVEYPACPVIGKS